jgi:formylglycine-generating enzyme required for sulfatase activity
MGNGKSADERLANLEQRVAYLSRLVLKAHQYQQSDPESALNQARKSAEAICYHLFRVEIGKPGNMMLEDLISKLKDRGIIPPRVVLSLKTIQLFGNFGSHAQNGQDGYEEVSVESVAPCLSALAVVTNWYFSDYLGIDLPRELERPGGDVPPPPRTMGPGTAPDAGTAPAPAPPATPREPRPAPPPAEAPAPDPPMEDQAAPSPPLACPAVDHPAAAPQDIHGWPTDAVHTLQRAVAERLGLPVVFRAPLKDGGEGPEMVVIPPGSYLMGAADDDDQASTNEKPQHRVTIARPFVIGRYPVTFDEYDGFCAATGRDQPSDQGWGRGRRPVINVSWDDAVAYCTWLSQQTGRTYRLPTEAEWEYAARAGTATCYWWGDEIGQGNANCDGGGSQWDTKQTAPVGSFQPNPFGLYDMAGNVWEWVQDPWHDDYQGASGNGSAWILARSGFFKKLFGDAAARRVFRGGSWLDIPWSARVSYRFRYGPDCRNARVGLRLAQDL